MGDLIEQYQISGVVLNACDSAYIGEEVALNFAASLIQNGTKNVVAMSHKVSEQTVALFMVPFYHTLISTRNWAESVYQGRHRLSTRKARNARYGIKLDCYDSCVPVHYIRFKETNEGDQALAETSSFPATVHHAQFTPDLQETGTKVIEIPDTYSLASSRCRDIDILRLEGLLVDRSLILVSGEAGSGKTALARYLECWWRDTRYASKVSYRSVMGSENDWFLQQLEQLEQESASLDSSISPNVSTSSKDSELYIIDDFLLPMTQNDEFKDGYKKSFPKQLVRLLQIYKESKTKKFLLFTASEPLQIQCDELTIFHYELAQPDALEYGQMISHYLSLTGTAGTISTNDRVDLEEALARAGGHVAFCESMLRMMSAEKLDFKEFLERSSGPVRMQSWYDACLHGRPLNVRTISSYETTWFMNLRNALRTLATMDQPGYCFVLSLAAFDRQIPADMTLWTAFLAQICFIPGLKDEVEVILHEQLLIYLPQFRQESLRIEWQQRWSRYREQLKTLGVIRELPLQVVQGQSTTQHQYLRLNPLLPVLLRQELSTQQIIVPEQAFSALRDILWLWYEKWVVDVGDKKIATPSEARTLQLHIEINENNLQSVILCGIERPDFSLRTMSTVNLAIQYLFSYNSSISRLRLRLWVNVLHQLLNRYESCNLEAVDWFKQSISFRTTFFIQTMSVVVILMQLTESLDRQQAACEVAKRTTHLTKKFGSSLPSETISIWTFPARCFLVEHDTTAQAADSAADMLSSNFDLDKYSGNKDFGRIMAETFVRLAMARLISVWNAQRSQIPRGHRLPLILLKGTADTEKWFDGLDSLNSNFFKSKSVLSWARSFIKQTLHGGNSAQHPTASDPELEADLSTHFEPLSAGYTKVKISLIQEYGNRKDEAGPVVGASGARLQNDLDVARHLGDLQLQEEILCQLFQIACDSQDISLAVKLDEEITSVSTSLCEAEIFDLQSSEVRKARREFLIGLAMRDEDGNFGAEEHRNITRAVASLLNARRRLLQLGYDQSTKILVEINATLTVVGLASYFEETSSNAVLPLEVWLSSMFDALRVTLTDPSAQVPFFHGDRPLVYLSVVYYLWRSSLNTLGLLGLFCATKIFKLKGEETDMLNVHAWERGIALALDWDNKEVGRFMKELDKSLRDVPELFIFPENPEKEEIVLRLDTEQRQVVKEAATIMVRKKTDDIDFICWKKSARGLWANEAGSTQNRSWTHSGVATLSDRSKPQDKVISGLVWLATSKW